MSNVTGLLSTQIRDALGVETSFPLFIEIDDSTTLAHMVSDALAQQVILDATIDGQIVGQTIKLEIGPNLAGGIKAAPNTGAEVERTALINYSQANFKYRQGFSLPTLAQSLIVNGKVDLTPGGAFITLVNLLINGQTYIKYTSKFVDALVALLDVVIAFRKHRKREAAVSFEE